MPGRTDLRRVILDQASRAHPAPPPTGRAGKASVTGHFPPQVRGQLRRLAADEDTTIQAQLGEALYDLFAKHGLPEIAGPG